MFVIQGIVDDLTYPPVSHQSQILEPAQLVGNGGLADAGECRQVADAHLVPAQGHENLKPARISEKAIDHGQGSQLVIRRCLAESALDPIGMNDPRPVGGVLMSDWFYPRHTASV